MNQRIDDLVRRNSAFRSFHELVHDHPGYRPSLDVSQPECLEIAEAYDKAQAERGDPRRAFRYGADRIRPVAAPPKPRPKPGPVHGPLETWLEVGLQGRIFVNQGKRDAVVIGVDGKRALIVYDMPAGRQFLVEIPRWRLLASERREFYRPIALKAAPQRWRAAIAWAIQNAYYCEE